MGRPEGGMRLEGGKRPEGQMRPQRPRPGQEGSDNRPEFPFFNNGNGTRPEFPFFDNENGTRPEFPFFNNENGTRPEFPGFGNENGSFPFPVPDVNGTGLLPLDNNGSLPNLPFGAQPLSETVDEQPEQSSLSAAAERIRDFFRG